MSLISRIRTNQKDGKHVDQNNPQTLPGSMLYSDDRFCNAGESASAGEKEPGAHPNGWREILAAGPRPKHPSVKTMEIAGREKHDLNRTRTGRHPEQQYQGERSCRAVTQLAIQSLTVVKNQQSTSSHILQKREQRLQVHPGPHQVATERHAQNPTTLVAYVRAWPPGLVPSVKHPYVSTRHRQQSLPD